MNSGFIILLWLLISLPIIQMKYGKFKTLPLAGAMQKVEKPTLNIDGLESGEFQSKYEEWFGQNFGLREYFIKTNKQLFYSIFNQTPPKDNVTVGKDNQLYGEGYINEYLGFNPPMDKRILEEKIKKMKRLQDLLQQRGQAFLLLLTPSKAAIYPENLPDRLLSKKINIPRNYDNIIPLLHKYGVQYIDGHSITDTQKKSSGYDMFPQGGTHWNYLAAYYTAKASVEKLEKITGGNLVNFDLNKIEQGKPTGTDRDLADLMNLWFPPINYTSPKPIISVDKDSGGYKPTILIEGGSFSGQIIQTLSDISMFKQLDYYFYYNSHSQFRLGEGEKYQGQISNVDWNNDVLNRDIIIIEMNEEYISGKLQSKKIFFEDLLAQLEPIDLKFSNINTTLVDKTKVDGVDGYILKKGAPPSGTVYLESDKIQLVPGKDYKISYKAKGFPNMNFDLFPDDLPQYNNDEITDDVKEFSYVFKSDSANIKSATARFFIDGLQKETDRDTLIYDIKLMPNTK
jgi:alginate O-acetyltransferase complex protein AlgJ